MSSSCSSNMETPAKLASSSSDITRPVELASSPSDITRPFVWRNLDLGPCLQLWRDPGYLAEKLNGIKASWHKSDKPSLDFRAKNFAYVVKDMGEIFADCNGSDNIQAIGSESKSETSQSDSKTFWYYRATTKNGKVAQLDQCLKPISEDFVLPEKTLLGEPYSELFSSTVPPAESPTQSDVATVCSTPEKTESLAEALCNSTPGKSNSDGSPTGISATSGCEVYSSILRICSPDLCMWIHYDVQDNCLAQITGHKRVLIWDPTFAADLGIDIGDSSSRYGSRVFSFLDERTESNRPVAGDLTTQDPLQPELEDSVFLHAIRKCIDVVLSPGDVLRIPAFWPHATQDVPATHPLARRNTEQIQAAAQVHPFGIAVNAFYKTPDFLKPRNPEFDAEYTANLSNAAAEAEKVKSDKSGSKQPKQPNNNKQSQSVDKKTIEFLPAVYSKKDVFCNTDFPAFTESVNAIEGIGRLPKRARGLYLAKLKKMLADIEEAP